MSRDALREALLLGLDDDGGDRVVHWGREFVDYRQLDGGGSTCASPTARRFAPISSSAPTAPTRGCATQRLPGLDRVDLGILNVAGRSPLTPSLTSALPAGRGRRLGQQHRAGRAGLDVRLDLDRRRRRPGVR